MLEQVKTASSYMSLQKSQQIAMEIARHLLVRVDIGIMAHLLHSLIEGCYAPSVW